MNSMRPKVFIGSSSKSLPLAIEVNKVLNKHFECAVWNEPSIWDCNKSTFDNLLRIVALFDCGVFIAGKDDLTLKNNDIIISTRDNVILEMALFVGALGKDKSLLLVSKGVSLPTDFNGIYMPRFEDKSRASLKKGCDEIIRKIEEQSRFGHFNLYPTTVLAIGYYRNFIAGLVQTIQDNPSIEIDGKHFSSAKIKIVIPKNIHGDIRENSKLYYRKLNLQQSTLNARFRPHPVWFQLGQSTPKHAILYDMPSTLTALNETIEKILHKNYQGYPKIQRIIEQRELANFKKVLQLLIDESPFAQETVEIVDED